MANRKSSRRWLDRHVNDPYVQQAQRDGYRSRAAYKLLELDERDRLLRRGLRVVDLGAAPGGWSQVAARLVGAGALAQTTTSITSPSTSTRSGTSGEPGTNGPVGDLVVAPAGKLPVAPTGDLVFAMDLLPMAPIPGVAFVQGDFREDADFARLQSLLHGAPVDLVLSDMAPNVSGMHTVDQPRSMLLVELAAEFAERVLKPGGALVVKAFQGEGFDALVKGLRGAYAKVVIRKPQASRPDSREVYLVAKGRQTR